MRYEVERKAWLRDPAAAEKNLLRVGKFAGEWSKDDRYYLLPGRKAKGRIDTQKDPIFRIRVEKTLRFPNRHGKSRTLAHENAGVRCILGVKRRSFAGKTEINEEMEIQAGSPEETIRFFEEYMRFSPFVRKHKRTKLFIVGGVNIELNHVEGLGWFIEAEISKNSLTQEEKRKALYRIDSIFKRLGVREKDIEPRYYIQMLLEK